MKELKIPSSLYIRVWKVPYIHKPSESNRNKYSPISMYTNLNGVISFLGALCYAELGTLVPKSGGEYTYIREGFGSLHRGLGNSLAFLFSWISVVVIKPSSMAIIAMAFGYYVSWSFADDCVLHSTIVKALAIACVCKCPVLPLRMRRIS